MKYNLILTGAMLITSMLLSACSEATITLQDIPVHPKSGENVADTFSAASPPEDQYSGFDVTGTNVYVIRNSDLTELSIDDFYQKELTDLGWEPGESTMYLNAQAGAFCVSQPWSKGLQIIYLAACPHPVQAAIILSVVLLTK